jgi:hypothetical protein
MHLSRLLEMPRQEPALRAWLLPACKHAAEHPASRNRPKNHNGQDASARYRTFVWEISRDERKKGHPPAY